LAVIKLCKKKLGKKFRGENFTERGDKRHGYNSNAIAKLLKMKLLIVTLVIKVFIICKKKIIIMIMYYKTLEFNAWGGGLEKKTQR
jgi:hypothetical protein